MIYAEIKDGKIINRSVWDKIPPNELELKRIDDLPEDPQIGWDYDKINSKYIKPVERAVVAEVEPTKLVDIDLTKKITELEKDFILKKLAVFLKTSGIV